MARQLKIREWLWRPMYARFWWSAVPLYWGGLFASSRVEFLADFYGSALAGFINVFFFPPIVAIVLSYGFFKAWLAAGHFEMDDETEEYWERSPMRNSPSGMLREFDPLDPASGSNWIGSPLNPSHPFYVIRPRHSS
ncbi:MULTISPECIES: hypothetical protein [Sphingobium]|jgi:hypothetical protein|uniref:Uncharacterized protein n=1 Tax=Sphingobium yanoikuyae TaxID=13690 RepID=A0A2D1R540_SPHYA|nr:MULTISPECIES: hypothetical protein [Sphingobium]ATP19977.1 hypothetical protein BV87_17310 [Sphingobium yanoikuyae]